MNDSAFFELKTALLSWTELNFCIQWSHCRYSITANSIHT